MTDIYDLVDEQRAQLGALDQQTTARMAAAYAVLSEQAKADLASFQRRLERWQADHPSMDPRGSSPSRHWVFQEDRYQSLVRQLRVNLAFYSNVSAGALTQAQERAARQASGDLPKLIGASMGGDQKALGKLGMAVLPEKAITAMVGFASDGTPLNELLRERAFTAHRYATEALVDGVTFGRSPNVIASTLDGHLLTLHWQNLRLARTETMRAYREATRVGMLQNADILSGWRWSSAADARTCAVCLSQHGKVFPLKLVPPSKVPPNAAQHKGLADVYADPPKKATALPPKEAVVV